MKIGVVSDTHVRTNEELDTFIKIFHEHFSDVDLLLHAGDLVNLSIFEWLSKQVKTIAVRGNMDFPDVSAALPQSRIVDLGRFKIGLTHGWGPPSGLTNRIRKTFVGSDGKLTVDCIVFGHTHSALSEMMDGILFFNPGAPTDKRFAPFNSVGFLEIGSKLEGRIERI